MKKNNRKNFLATMLAMLMCVCAVCSPVLAAERPLMVQNSISEGGYLNCSTDTYSFTLDKSTTYTVTMVPKITSGDGIWFRVAKDGQEPFIDEPYVTSAYQKRFYLTAGSYKMMLSSPTGIATYGVSISETFSRWWSNCKTS